MNLVRILVTVLFLFSANMVFAAHQLYADLNGINIPYGTKFELSMADNLTSQSVIEGEIFQAYLKEDVYVNNKLILPAKTIFRGRVSEIKYSRKFSRPAALVLTLDHLVTKQGSQVPINSGMASSFEYILKPDGSITTDGNYIKAVSRDLKASGQIAKRSLNWGKTSSDELFKGARYIFIPLAAIGGGAACACSAVYNTIADMFRHGDEIIIKKDSTFSIILLSNLELPS